MKYCNNCGNQLNDDAVACRNCGAEVNNPANDKVNPCLAILSFFMPLIGLIIFLIYKNESPKASKVYGIATVAGFFINLILSIIVYVFFAVYGEYTYY